MHRIPQAASHQTWNWAHFAGGQNKPLRLRCTAPEPPFSPSPRRTPAPIGAADYSPGSAEPKRGDPGYHTTRAGSKPSTPPHSMLTSSVCTESRRAYAPRSDRAPILPTPFSLFTFHFSLFTFWRLHALQSIPQQHLIKRGIGRALRRWPKLTPANALHRLRSTLVRRVHQCCIKSLPR